MKSYQVTFQKRRSILFCSLIILVSFVSGGGVAFGFGCHWTSNHKRLKCEPIPYCTGCIGLRNITGKEVRIFPAKYVAVPRAPNKLIVSTTPNVFSEGQDCHADYDDDFYIYTCQVKNSDGSWETKNCYDVFDRSKNNSHGGGCGCEFFECLPSTAE